jgi:alginate production protein
VSDFCRITLGLCAAASVVALLSGTRPAHAGDVLTVERSLHLDVLHENNLGLRPRAGQHPRDRQDNLAVKLRYSVQVKPDGPVSGFAEVELRYNIDRRRGEPRETETELRLREAYLEIADVLVSDLDVRVGRWDFEDDRRWLIDARLDGLWMRYRGKRLEVDLLAARENQFRADLLDRASRDGDTDYIAGLLSHEASKAATLGAHAILQRETGGSGDRLRLLGLRAQGEAFVHLRYWADVAWSDSTRNGRNTRGNAVDLGGVWQWDHPWQPRLTLAWARGSGGFRQTELHSNEGSLGQDIETFYYGEVLRPELANLSVLTIGAGVSVNAKLFADLYWRDYRLGDARQGLRGATLRADPVSDGALGRGLDLVIGYRPTETFEVDAALGWFNPGRAFARTRQGRAFAARLEMTWRF